MDENINILDTVSKLFVSWNVISNNFEYNAEDYDDELANEPLVKIIRGKLKWGGVDVIVPDHLALMISLCSETPAEVQMITVDILDYLYDKFNGNIPKGYIIKPTDFAEVFPMKFPIVSVYKDIKDKYNTKWDEQKTPNRENSYDSKEFWSKYIPKEDN